MVDLDTIEVAPELLDLVPQATASRLGVLPISAENGTIVFAIPEGHASQLLDDLAFLTGRKVEARTVPQSKLHDAIRRCYGPTGFDTSQKSPEPANNRSDEPNPSTITELVSRLVKNAIRIGASDIHVEPYESSLRVRYRIDGVLREVERPPVAQTREIISRLKIMADLDIAEKRRPQDGRIRVRDGEKSVDIRVSTLPTDFGEKVVLRILDKSQLQLDLTRLGFESSDLKLFEQAIRLPYGMILVTGPTGSGKTTTLYAALSHINNAEINITTIEDPIEYNLPGINQTHVRADIGLTFAASLRSILRQDPNVIMVGEIRDAETAEIAIRAALTGHLVFSTLHTNDAPSAITRLIDIGVEPFLVASAVKMILAQRLLRKLCPHCRRRGETCEAIGQEIVGDGYFEPVGCESCYGTGYSGRTATYEVMPVEGPVSDLAARGAPTSEIMSGAVAKGMKTLRAAALKKASCGETSLSEVFRETIGTDFGAK